jgi:hypothetical protein
MQCSQCEENLFALMTRRKKTKNQKHERKATYMFAKENIHEHNMINHKKHIQKVIQ